MPHLELAAAWYGTVPNWLTVIAIAGLVVLLRGGQLGPALGYLREANSTLADENRQLQHKVRELEAEKVLLVARTDLAPMQTLMIEQAKAHEDRAQGRYEATLKILDLIADRLGPDTDAGAAGQAG